LDTSLLGTLNCVSRPYLLVTLYALVGIIGYVALYVSIGHIMDTFQDTYCLCSWTNIFWLIGCCPWYIGYLILLQACCKHHGNFPLPRHMEYQQGKTQVGHFPFNCDPRQMEYHEVKTLVGHWDSRQMEYQQVKTLAGHFPIKRSQTDGIPIG
jgi:hypothetical protein